MKEERLVIVGDQKNLLVSVYDLSKGNLAVKNAKKTFPAGHTADGRVRVWQNRWVLLVTQGLHEASIYDYETGELLWTTKAAPENPHAIELLPSGVIAVAGSNASAVRFFHIHGSGFTDVELPDAHGVLYDPTRDVVWAIGQTNLKAYKVSFVENEISVEEVKAYTLPQSGAHDLQPVYGEKGKVWVTTSTKVWQVDGSTGESTLAFEPQKNVKGIGNFEDGAYAYCYPDKGYYPWTTRSVFLVTPNGKTKEIQSDEVAIYKLRVLNPDYQ